MYVSRSFSPIVDNLSGANFRSPDGGEGAGQIGDIMSRVGQQFVGTRGVRIDQLSQGRALAAPDPVLNTRQLAASRVIGDELGWNAPNAIPQTA